MAQTVWERRNCGNEELAFLASAIKEGSTSRRRWLQMQLAINNRRRFLNLVCLLLLLIPEGTSQFNCDESRPVQFVPVVGFFKIHSFCHFLSKTWLAVRHRTTCFLTRYTLIAFKYGTPQTEVVYAHQASIFCALEARGTRIFPLFPPFCSKRSKQAVYAWQNGKHAELWVKINLFHVFVMYALGSVHEKFDVWIGVAP